MFNKFTLSDFYLRHQSTLKRLEVVRGHLESRIFNGETAINAIFLAALTDVPCLLFGPPGVAKSKLIRNFCEITGVSNSDSAKDRKYFEYLLSPFTEPTELFGSFRLQKVDSGEQQLVRVETGMLHKCEVAFLDEVFNGSSAILNSLLALINEGKFHDRGEIKNSNLKLIFGATNDLPKSDDLRAVFDRFVVRAYMDNTEPDSVEYRKYFDRAFSAQRSFTTKECDYKLLGDIQAMREDYLELERATDRKKSLFDLESEEGRKFLGNLSYIVENCRGGQGRASALGTFSNRRVFQMLRALTMQRLMRAAREGGITGASGIKQVGATLSMDDYRIIWTHFLDIDKPASNDVVSKMLDMPNVPMTSGAKT